MEIKFLHKDAFDVIPKYLRDKSATFFVDPPYTAGGKSAGKRLYLHSSIDRDSLFDLLGSAAGEVMLTYDDAKEVRDLATAHGFFVKPIPMKTTHHTRMYELALTNRPLQRRMRVNPCAFLSGRRIIGSNARRVGKRRSDSRSRSGSNRHRNSG